MKSRTLTTFILALSAFSPFTIADPKQRIEDVDKNAITITEVIQQVQNGLVMAQTSLSRKNMPELVRVTLSLQTIISKEGGPAFKFFIFSYGKKWQTDRVQTVSISLIPPTPKETSEVGSDYTLAESLADAVVSSARGIEEARTGEYPLELDSLETTFKFVVKTGTKGGLGFVIEPVTFDFKGSINQQAIHHLAVMFKGKKYSVQE